MSLTEAAKEAYAEPDVETVVYDTIELNHPVFDAPVYIVCNVEQDMVFGGVNHLAMGVRVQLVGYDDDGQTTGRVEVDNVSRMLQPYLQDAILAGDKISIVYRAYLEGNPNTPAEVRGGLFLSRVTLSATTATGTLEGASKYDLQAFPRLTYDMDSYKGLHGI